MTSQAEIGLIGLGVMGQSLALNIADHGSKVAVYNRTSARTEAFAASEEARGLPLEACLSLEDLVAALRRPRAVILMVKADEATDHHIDALAALLEPGDVIVDGGNARYQDTIRRERALRERKLMFLGTGISGGEEGARHGPSIMAGGEPQAYQRVGPIFEAIAAQVDGTPCAAHVGPDGAGHFVKMIHNGIEYADMQLIAETYALMKDVQGLGYPAMQAAFAEWNRGELDSYLIAITADILGKTDPETGQPMVEVILDRAGQKGTGGWALAAALELGVPAPTMAEAVAARSLSALKTERVAAAGKLPGPESRPASGPCARRGARRPARRQALRLRPGLRGDGRRQRGARLVARLRHDRDHLARRLHHPRPLPRSHQAGLRPRARARQPVARPLLQRADGPHPERPARGRSRRPPARASRRRPWLRRSPISTATARRGCRRT